jgi:hypothetical protein
LTREERDHIRSGSVFIWDEDEANILRWTDGRRWSSSRPCGNFIIYDELDSGLSRDSSMMSANSHNSQSSMYSSRNSGQIVSWHMDPNASYDQQHQQQRSAQWHAAQASRACNTARNNYSVLRGGLIKRALSINAADGRRMHLVSYYTASDVERKQLKVPRNDPRFEGVKIRKLLYPELVCENSLNGGTTWRFAEAQGRGHAYAAGTREGKTTPSRSESATARASPSEEYASPSSSKIGSAPITSTATTPAPVATKEPEQQQQQRPLVAYMKLSPVERNIYEQRIHFTPLPNQVCNTYAV